MTPLIHVVLTENSLQTSNIIFNIIKQSRVPLEIDS